LAAHRAGKVIPGLDPGIIPWRFHRVMLAKASPRHAFVASDAASREKERDVHGRIKPTAVRFA